MSFLNLFLSFCFTVQKTTHLSFPPIPQPVLHPHASAPHICMSFSSTGYFRDGNSSSCVSFRNFTVSNSFYMVTVVFEFSESF